MTDALLSGGILLLTLALFVSEKVRHDLVAVCSLFACLLLGLVKPADALSGFSDPAVIAVAAVLVVGRAVELSGVAAALTRRLIPHGAGFTLQLAAVLVVGAALSAFMNNIAALVVTMPIATQIARDCRRPASAVLMPLAFATILGGMTTLIGTPANLILSSVREEQLGAGFNFFAMAPVGIAVTAAGLLYLITIGHRLLPSRDGGEVVERPPWRAFELAVRAGEAALPIRQRLRRAEARALAIHRGNERLQAPESLEPGDRLLVVSRRSPWEVADSAGLNCTEPRGADDDVTARVSVAYGSALIGLSYPEVRLRSESSVNVIAVGPRPAWLRQPLGNVQIQAGDQLFLRGSSGAIANFVTEARLLEIDRLDVMPVASRKAALVVSVFVLAILTIVFTGLSPALCFLGAAAAMTALRLLPARDVYRAIDWPVIVLLAAMIPVGNSFEESGAAAIVAQQLGALLGGASLVVVLASLCAVTLVLTVFLNNVATALIMGPFAVQVASILGIPADAALLAVLIGTSSDFLTPIGHQNNLLVMAPGGYRFADYARSGAMLAVLVVGIASAFLAWQFG